MADASEILRAAELILAGKLVAFPTETVYGLGANALDAVAVKRIYDAKGRPQTSPLIVHVSSRAMTLELAAEWPAAAEQLAAHFWPGPLTLVVPKSSRIPDIVTAGLATVGLRMPDHDIALALIDQAGVPIAAPSANRFSELSPTTADHVRESLGAAVDLVIDGGPSQVGIESTVVAVNPSGGVSILRPGMITADEIAAIVGVLEPWRQEAGGDPAPGMTPRHYSPHTPLRLGRPNAPGHGVFLHWSGPERGAASIRMPRDAASYASALYEMLHRLDREGWDWIAVEPVPPDSAWDGVRDRLTRAAAPSDAGNS
jgi:L-threonylcarbamoyladenylate synthase